MTKFTFSDIEIAFMWVSAAMYGMNSATLCTETGRIIYESDMGDFDLPVEDDDPVWEQRVEVPHKNDLDLGRNLVFEFVEAHLPHEYNRVRGIFRSRGAYGRYKALLDRNGLLQTWFNYENSRTEDAIRAWCKRNQIELEEEVEHSEISEQAVNYFKEDYLCSQAVLMAFAPQLGLESETAAKIAAPFGAGIGHLGQNCGAVSGALMVIGLKYGHESAHNEKAKERTFGLTRKFLEEFKSRHKSLLCRELLERDISNANELELARSEGVFEERCPNFVRDAAEIVEELLKEN